MTDVLANWRLTDHPLLGRALAPGLCWYRATQAEVGAKARPCFVAPDRGEAWTRVWEPALPTRLQARGERTHSQ